ncbi:glutamyl-tRNA(Gln) amidotransferase subunit A [bacterium MnTg04]|nr:glutamyl-tRNA(Gln) amidotransferase subunit A [bacterium MnTg04]
MTIRLVVIATILTGIIACAQDEADPIPAYLSVGQLQEAMTGGEFSSAELVSHLLARIEEIDRRGPGLHSIIEINPDALAIATALDDERRAGRVRGPLHGIPIVLKANIDTGDRMATTAGSLALAGHRAPDDAFHVAALREAGAIILGKTNLSEWANFRSSASSSGWSGIGGQTKNPYVLNRNPCGSSSGSAVAVAAGLVPLAIGTETDGSVICPSGINGVVGIKPTVGLVSRDGIIPISHTQDTAGPMARSVWDAALLLSAMAKKDATDPASAGYPGDKDYTAGLSAAALDSVRIGVWRKYRAAGKRPRVEAIFEQTIARLKELGATIVDPIDFAVPDLANDAEYEVFLYEFKTNLNQYLAGAGVEPPADTLAGIIAFNRDHADESMPWFGQDILEQAEGKGTLDEPEYLRALENSNTAMRRALDEVLSRHALDAIVAPSNSPAWQTNFLNGDHDRHFLSSSGPAAIAGYPAISLPAGEVLGLPVGITFLGAPFTEEKLIRYAFLLEQAIKARKNPQFIRSLEE